MAGGRPSHHDFNRAGMTPRQLLRTQGDINSDLREEDCGVITSRVQKHTRLASATEFFLATVKIMRIS